MACSRVLVEVCDRAPWCGEALAAAALLQGWDEAHGLPHSVRVACIALRLAGEVGEERLDLVAAAALLHDVGRGLEDEAGVHHALLSAWVAEHLLSRHLGAGGVEEVKRAILEHSFSAGGRSSTRLSCIVSDADKLDALGAVGVARTVIHGHESGRPLTDTLSHYYEKLRRLPDLLCLEASRRLAEERLAVMDAFFVALRGELLESEDAVALLGAKAFDSTRRLARAGGGLF